MFISLMTAFIVLIQARFSLMTAFIKLICA